MKGHGYVELTEVFPIRRSFPRIALVRGQSIFEHKSRRVRVSVKDSSVMEDGGLVLKEEIEPFVRDRV